jgi:hypothetical protein
MDIVILRRATLGRSDDAFMLTRALLPLFPERMLMAKWGKVFLIDRYIHSDRCFDEYIYINKEGSLCYHVGLRGIPLVLLAVQSVLVVLMLAGLIGVAECVVLGVFGLIYAIPLLGRIVYVCTKRDCNQEG